MKKRIVAFLLVAFLAVGCGAPKQENNASNGPVVVGQKADKEEAVKITVAIDNRVLNEKANFEKVKPEYQKYISEDGYILKDIEVEVYGDATVLEILEAVSKETNTPIVVSEMSSMKYVSAINHLEGGSVGDMSGWLYDINRESATVGADQMKVKNGDKVRWAFSLDGGEDIKALK